MRSIVLRHRVTIQESVQTRDLEYGSPVDAWQDVATVWGAVEDLSGREFFAAQQVNAEVSSRIRIRYRDGVAPKMRALSSGRTYDILAVLDPDGRRRELHLMCKVVV